MNQLKKVGVLDDEQLAIDGLVYQLKKELPEATKIDPKYNGKKISRNEPCPCGSGKKYKKCCGAL